MKLCLSILFLLLICSSWFLFDSIYAVSFKTIDGQPLNMRNYKNKKLLFVVAPLSASDTSFSLTELAALQAKYDTTLVVFGIPAADGGFVPGDEGRLKALYRSQRHNFILAAGMNVKKTTGGIQSSLFQWLTHKEKNRHFDAEVRGVGQKFFVDERGELYAVLGPEIKLTHLIIERVLSKPLRH